MKAIGGLAVIWILVVIMSFSGCSFGVQVGWHGKTGVDNETVTPEFRSASTKGGRY